MFIGVEVWFNHSNHTVPAAQTFCEKHLVHSEFVNALGSLTTASVV
jgi:hypothetical protein